MRRSITGAWWWTSSTRRNKLAVVHAILGHELQAYPQARAKILDRLQALAAADQLLGRPDGDVVDIREILAAELSHYSEARISTKGDEVKLPAKQAATLTLIFHELATNAAKHAYPMGEPGELLIQAHRQGERLVLVVADRGAGLADGFDPAAGEGLGLEILRRIVSQLHGRLHAESDGGARFTLNLPAPSASRPVRSFAPPAA